MKCEDWQELILEQELLEPAERQELGQHLSHCPGCRAWAKALSEVDATLASHLRAEFAPFVLTPRSSRAVAREQRWTKCLPELLDTLGWSALGVLLVAPLLLPSSWSGWHLWLAGAGTIGGSLVWAVQFWWKQQAQSRRLS